MTETIPRTITAAQAARARQCPLCQAASGTPCQPKPTGDHLARYLDAYTPASSPAPTCAPWVGELVVIDRAVLIRDGER